MSNNQTSSKKSKIFFLPLCSQGHVNYCITITRRLFELYGTDQVEVHYAVNEEYRDILVKKVPEAIFHVYITPDEIEKAKSGKNWLIELMQAYGETWSNDALSMVNDSAHIFGQVLESGIESFDDIEKIVKDVKPDLIIYDNVVTIPAGINQGIPWINLFSIAMNFIGLPRIPAPQSGLPTAYTPENEKLWNDFIEKAYRNGPYSKIRQRNEEFLRIKNINAQFDKDTYMSYLISPYMNIYCYPKELDYTLDRPIELPGGPWLRIDTPVLKPFPAPYVIPEKLKNKPGKLIYFSLGSMASSYRPLMVKVIEVLSQLPHRFIVSKGLFGREFDSIMGDNMDGEDYLNQFAVLQTVDMVITHGGNNTLTEAYNFGKPLIIAGLFGDQKCNAQRVHEIGLGRKFNLLSDKIEMKKDLEEAIEFCSQESMAIKMKEVSERIQKDSGLDHVCEELMKICKK